MLKENMTILFQGDSITDCCRYAYEMDGLGYGYATIVASRLMYDYPELNLKFINRGIGGNRVADLVERWDKDCINIQPDILTILIGINNVWREFDSNDPTTNVDFEKYYREVLIKTKEKTNAKIIIMSPFLIPYPEDRNTWRKGFDEKKSIVEKLVKEFDLEYIDIDKMFLELVEKKEAKYWAEDGVHPTPAGHQAIANALLEVLCCR